MSEKNHPLNPFPTNALTFYHMKTTWHNWITWNNHTQVFLEVFREWKTGTWSILVHVLLNHLRIMCSVIISSPVGMWCCGNIGILLDFHRNVDRLPIDIAVTKLYGIFLQHHNKVVLITQRNVKLHVIVIPIFNAVLMSDKDVNAINKGKHVLFHLSKHFDNIF